MYTAALENLSPTARADITKKPQRGQMGSTGLALSHRKSSAEDLIPTFTLPATSTTFCQYCPLFSTAERVVVPDY